MPNVVFMNMTICETGEKADDRDPGLPRYACSHGAAVLSWSPVDEVTGEQGEEGGGPVLTSAVNCDSHDARG